MTANTFGTLDILMKHSKEDNLAKFLPDSLLVPSSHTQEIPLSSLSFSMRWLATIHPSWIAIAMKELPKEIQSQLLACLPETLVRELLPSLPNVTVAQKRCSNFGAFYLLNMLNEKLRPKGIVEEVFLPASTINAILYYSGPTKISVINCLGLCYLAKELKNVVDKVVLERVKKLLSSTEKLFLTYCQSHPMKNLETTNFLSSWDQDSELHQFIHIQGLRFLGKALVKEDASFLWYFLRRLDIRRGYIFEQALKESYGHSYVDYYKNNLERCLKVLIQ
ncbi:hypothetical protein [Chlamydia sp. 17-3921]|uniref:hypothetical protein n=1 Tax=Chlamydia sp. 17-3921 TaxID=2675798 RepID=UPI00191ADD1F|nr:hypothetical protein [Chlamydia sp. 17-3921]